MIYTIISSTGYYDDCYEHTLGYSSSLVGAEAIVKLLKEEYSDWDDEWVDPKDGQLRVKSMDPDYTKHKTLNCFIDEYGPKFSIEELESLDHITQLTSTD